MPPSTTVVLPFTVTNSGTSATTFGVTVSCSGPCPECKRVAGNLTSFDPAPSLLARPVHDITVTGGAMAGSGTLSLVAVPTGQSAYSGPARRRSRSRRPAAGASREPGAGAASVAPSTSRTAHFTLRNPDEFASRTITLTGTCGTLTNCAVSPSTVTLGPTRDTLVSVSFSVPASPSTQTTKVLLRAAASSPADSAGQFDRRGGDRPERRRHRQRRRPESGHLHLA
ncbi:MAG: hypothetical protein IPJ78_16845 [Gemmatimonadetes bacterium]|nr:hypothetical protein [Gemmatimonadota bacterium]